MARDYNKMAADILAAVGGRDNISSVVHCATRLRFVLKNESKASTDQLNRIEGVITVVKKGGQHQVVIGNTVPEVYKAVLAAGNLDNLSAEDDAPKGNILNRLIDTISGIFPPLLGAMCAAGLIKGIVAILEATGVLKPEMGTYTVLSTIGDALFYFLPVLLGFSAGRKFGGNPYVTAVLGAVLIHPNIMAMVNDGASLTFLKIPVVLMNYSSSVIPILFAAYISCWMEKKLNKILPSAIKNFIAPLICLLVTAPLTLIIIGPACTYLSQWLADGYQFLFDLSPVIGGAIIGAFWQVLVIFGLHWGFIPVMMNNIKALGKDTLGPAAQVAAMSQTGAALGIALRTKDKAKRSMTISSVIAGVFGITEPIIYGITLPRKKPFVMASIAGAIGGGLGGLIGAEAYGVGALGVFAIPMSVSSKNSMALIGLLVGMVTSFVLAAVLVFLTCKEEPAEGTKEPLSDNTPAQNRNTPAVKTVLSPAKGEVKPLSASKDPVHAEEALGTGALLFPSEGKIYAPFDCDVNIVYETKHALGLTSDDGVELLIHVGMDTVRLGGKHYTSHVNQGDHVTAGTLLLSFDMAGIQSEGYSIETPVVVTNSPDFMSIQKAADGLVENGDVLLTIQ